MHDTIWAQSTVEELLSRQFVRPSPCNAYVAARRAAKVAEKGLFRPGLRVVAIDALQVDRWLDDPVAVTIEG